MEISNTLSRINQFIRDDKSKQDISKENFPKQIKEIQKTVTNNIRKLSEAKTGTLIFPSESTRIGMKKINEFKQIDADLNKVLEFVNNLTKIQATEKTENISNQASRELKQLQQRDRNLRIELDDSFMNRLSQKIDKLATHVETYDYYNSNENLVNEISQGILRTDALKEFSQLNKINSAITSDAGSEINLKSISKKLTGFSIEQIKNETVSYFLIGLGMNLKEMNTLIESANKADINLGINLDEKANNDFINAIKNNRSLALKRLSDFEAYSELGTETGNGYLDSSSLKSIPKSLPELLKQSSASSDQLIQFLNQVTDPENFLEYNLDLKLKAPNQEDINFMDNNNSLNTEKEIKTTKTQAKKSSIKKEIQANKKENIQAESEITSNPKQLADDIFNQLYTNLFKKNNSEDNEIKILESLIPEMDDILKSDQADKFYDQYFANLFRIGNSSSLGFEKIYSLMRPLAKETIQKGERFAYSEATRPEFNSYVKARTRELSAEYANNNPIDENKILANQDQLDEIITVKKIYDLEKGVYGKEKAMDNFRDYLKESKINIDFAIDIKKIVDSDNFEDDLYKLALQDQNLVDSDLNRDIEQKIMLLNMPLIIKFATDNAKILTEAVNLREVNSDKSTIENRKKGLTSVDEIQAIDNTARELINEFITDFPQGLKNAAPKLASGRLALSTSLHGALIRARQKLSSKMRFLTGSPQILQKVTKKNKMKLNGSIRRRSSSIDRLIKVDNQRTPYSEVFNSEQMPNTLAHQTPDDKTLSPMEYAEKMEEHQLIDSVLNEELSPRESDVLKLRHGFGTSDAKALNLDDIGGMFNLSRERIRQIESKALRKMRYPMRNVKLQGLLDTYN
ncbi:MAG: hypothetical protein MK033_02885 [Candidatus Caenarcaniphilales bacterium]|nr:hypothetical protein [Candidatus Caenarcaniphilales bacterium]